MPLTRIIDVIQPEIFTPYSIQRTMELSELIQAGIAQNDAQFDSLASGPNTLVNMPFWQDLTGEPEVMNDTDKTEPGKIGTDKDVARKLAWTKSFGANALAGMLAGSDPMRAIADLFASYWTRQYQQMLLAVLDGIFKSANMADKVHDITAETGEGAQINAHTFVDAMQKMGDAKDLLTGIMMHSAVEAHLTKNDAIEYVEDSTSKSRIRTFLGKRVIVDDSMPYDTVTKAGVAYLFGQGAIAWGNGSHPGIQQTETVRDGLSLAGEDVLVNRRVTMIHPRGIKWTEDAVADVFPSKAELATGTNWARVYEPKAIRIVKFMFKIA